MIIRGLCAGFYVIANCDSRLSVGICGNGHSALPQLCLLYVTYVMTSS